MFLKVIYDAKIGKDRHVRETYMNTDSDGTMRMEFDKDIDWTQPIFMMLVPDPTPMGDTNIVKNPAWIERLLRRST